VSYDIVVWVGATPASDAEALAVFARHAAAMEAAIEGDAETEPHPRLIAFAGVLHGLYPDPEDDDTPWAAGPPDDIVGDALFIAMRPSRAHTAIPAIVEAVEADGLVGFDAQTETLLTPAAPRPRASRLRRFRRRA
jgi:hypothetical protein